MPKSIISIFVFVQAALLLALLESYDAFMNLETAFVSSLLIVLGSLYSYRNLVHRRIASGDVPGGADVVEKIDDPYDLYDEAQTTKDDPDKPVQEIIKEEKAKLKANRSAVNSVRTAAPALVSVYRLVPYGILVLGFVALKNNEMLLLAYYLPGLALGIVAGYLAGKKMFLTSATR